MKYEEFMNAKPGSNVLVSLPEFERLVLAYSEFLLAAQLSEPKQKSVEVAYPENYYSGLYLIFSRRLSYEEMVRVRDIVHYWGKLPFVGDFKYTEATTFNSLKVFVYEEESASSDPRSHRPFELLAEYIEQGTPVRSTKNNTRAHEGLGSVLASVEGFS